MRTVQDIYTEYKIMPSLQLHQLRVAAVGKYVCEHVRQSANAHDVVLACLFHDMGNIIKFDLLYFPEFLEPEGLEYWKAVKDGYVLKYGPEQHAATEAIAKEIGLSEEVRGYIAAIGFSKVPEVLAGSSLEKKICQYADLRVSPHGVLSVGERIADGRKRYTLRTDKAVAPRDGRFEALTEAAQQLESQIFAEATIPPEDVSDGAIAPSLEELRKYPVA